MRTTRLYVESKLEVGVDLDLQPEQAHYLANVLRMRVGDRLRIFNGEACEYEAKVKEAGKKRAVLTIDARHECNRESPLCICLGIGLSKGPHMDFSVQKAVELGVQTIVPVLSEYSNVKIKADRVQNKMSHWQQIIINATEQCGRTKPAVLKPPCSLDEFTAMQDDALKLMLHPDSMTGIEDISDNIDAVTLLIGPEGGFSEQEIEQAVKDGFRKVSFGPRILRAETAVTAAVAVCQNKWGDLNRAS